ncbi:hypothetical protein ACIOUG_16265 [Pseudomonas sp. NPDC087803]|uniref:hypothetical protein n=1 Tax=Pseudomonas sp. NPDC087803 TaxID=3364448 RepID=UPI0037FFCB9C
MLNDEKNPLPVDQALAEPDHPVESSENPVESIAVTLGNPLKPDPDSTTKPHKNTGSLDSLGGGRLP